MRCRQEPAARSAHRGRQVLEVRNRGADLGGLTASRPEENCLALQAHYFAIGEIEPRGQRANHELVESVGEDWIIGLTRLLTQKALGGSEAAPNLALNNFAGNSENDDALLRDHLEALGYL